MAKLTILHVKLDGRPVWRFAHPKVQVLALPRLEEEHIVAVVEFGQLVQLVQFRLRIELGVFPAVGQQIVDVVQEVTVSAELMMSKQIRETEFGQAGGDVPVCDASRRENEDSLLVSDFVFTLAIIIVGAPLRQRFVDGRHYCMVWVEVVGAVAFQKIISPFNLHNDFAIAKS